MKSIFNEREDRNMTEQEKLKMIAEIMDLELEELKEDALLTDYQEWDSVAVLSFIALMDEEFGKDINGTDVRELVTIKNLMDMMKA